MRSAGSGARPPARLCARALSRWCRGARWDTGRGDPRSQNPSPDTRAAAALTSPRCSTRGREQIPKRARPQAAPSPPGMGTHACVGTHGAPSTVTSTGSTLGCRAPSRGAAPDRGSLLGTGKRGLSRRIAEQLSAWGPSGTATAAPQRPATSPGETTRCGQRGGEGEPHGEHPTRLQRLSHACTSAHPRSSGTGRQHPGFGTPPTPSRDARLRAAPASPSRPRAPRSQAGSASPPPPHRGSPAAVAPSCSRRAPGSPRSAPASPPAALRWAEGSGHPAAPHPVLLPEAPTGHRSRKHPGGFPRGSRLFPTGTGHPPGEFLGPSRVTPAPAAPGLSSWQHPPAP